MTAAEHFAVGDRVIFEGLTGTVKYPSAYDNWADVTLDVSKERGFDFSTPLRTEMLTKMKTKKTDTDFVVGTTFFNQKYTLRKVQGLRETGWEFKVNNGGNWVGVGFNEVINWVAEEGTAWSYSVTTPAENYANLDWEL